MGIRHKKSIHLNYIQMKKNDQINYLRESAIKLQNSTEFRGLAVIMLAIALEKQVKNAVVYNYRKSGLTASFIRRRLLKGMGYAELLHELEWCGAFNENKKLKKIWQDKKTPIKNLFGVMETRNKIVHSNARVSSVSIDESVNQLLLVIENLEDIFQENFKYSGLEPLPKTIKNKELNVSAKLLHKSIASKFKGSK
jgi:hypothetical protein